MKLSRRGFTKLTAASAASILLPTGFYSAASTQDNARLWHHDVIKHLNRLKNKPSSIDCLVPNGCQANLKPLRHMLATQANIQLNLVVTPVDDINTRLFLAAGDNGQSFDMALPVTFGLTDLAANRIIQPLSQFAQRYEPAGFMQDSLYSVGDQFNDALYGYQTDGDAYLMFFNKAWLEDEDNRKRYEDKFSEVLALPNTWETLDRQMQFFHAPEKGRYGGALFRAPDYLVWEWWVRFHAKGYYPLADDLEPQIDNDAGIAALEALIMASDFLSPGSRNNGLFENWHEYGQGHCYCNIGWGGTQKYLNSPQSAIKDGLLFSPMPGGIIDGQVVRIPYFNWGWNYTVPANAKNPELAYLCALLAVTPHVSTLSVREDGYFDPFRGVHYQDATIQSIYSQDFLVAHRQSMMETIPDFYLIGQSKYMATLKTYLHRALTGDVSPKEALETVANSWRALHYRYGIEAQSIQWKRIKQRYPMPLQELLT
jgi:multiple sugar transport system substrate-binding protein